MNTIIAKFENKGYGIESYVVSGFGCFHVSLKDVDADEFVGITIRYKTESNAIAKAKELVS